MSADIYLAVTGHILDALATGTVPWKKPWHTTEGLPMNAVSKRPYRGVNVFLLGMTPHRDHRWLTFRQARELGGHVRQGEQSSLAIFWKRWEPGEAEDDGEKKQAKSIPILRRYNVFNVEQCEGLSVPPLEPIDRNFTHLRIEQAERLVKQMPDPPEIRECGGRAWYDPFDDAVQVPPLSSFALADAFYGTLFHELAHATGHAKRLNRPGVTGDLRFGSASYSREELVAELASAFCCASIGLDNSLLDNAAAYIAGWHKALKDNPKAITVAAAQAQRAADYLQTACIPN